MMNDVEPTHDPCIIDQLIIIKVNSLTRNVVTCILSVSEIMHFIIKVGT